MMWLGSFKTVYIYGSYACKSDAMLPTEFFVMTFEIPSSYEQSTITGEIWTDLFERRFGGGGGCEKLRFSLFCNMPFW